MEAMATGLPVISTYHSAIPKLIDNGINGFLVNEKDIESYSEKMYEILFVGNKFSSNARKKVSERFNLTKEVSHIMDIYKNLIDFNNKT
jgi:colanic acid/amylovoran biosynthesis glycosyltransferase